MCLVHFDNLFSEFKINKIGLNLTKRQEASIQECFLNRVAHKQNIKYEVVVTTIFSTIYGCPQSIREELTR